MLKQIKTIHREGRDEFVVSRSRFIGSSMPVTHEEGALSFIEGVRKTYWDASHHAWAYALGGSRERYSDDGEPRGTAGVPILEVIHKEGLQDLVIVVTRYFGGVKLGAGGLFRAYTQGAKAAISASGILLRLPHQSFRITAAYAHAEKLQKEFAAREYYVKDAEYTDQVTISLLVPPQDAEALIALTAECTAGQGVVLPGGEEYLDSIVD